MTAFGHEILIMTCSFTSVSCIFGTSGNIKVFRSDKNYGMFHFSALLLVLLVQLYVMNTAAASRTTRII